MTISDYNTYYCYNNGINACNNDDINNNIIYSDVVQEFLIFNTDSNTCIIIS